MIKGPTPYTELNAVLEDLITSVQIILRDTFVGACLQGSFALGDFDRHSDADFVVVVSGEVSTDQVSALQAVHRRVYGLDVEWAQHLEGSYFPVSILRDYHKACKPRWYVDHGSPWLGRAD